MNIHLGRQFPHSNIKNIALFYVLTFLSNFYFITGNWIFFWLRFMKYGELGLLDSIAFAFGFLMEVPTGAVADRIGRRKSIVAAFFLMCLGFTLISFTDGKMVLIIGYFITQIGWAFYSGAAEAMAYDSLKEVGEEDDFDKVISASNSFSKVAVLIGSVTGGFMYAWFFRLPHIFTSIAFGAGFVAALFLHEPVIHHGVFSAKKYLKQIKDGFWQLGLPGIQPFLLLILVVSGTGFLFSAGIIQPAIATKLGYDATSLSLLSALSILVAIGAIQLIPWMRTHLTDNQGLYVLGIVFATCFALAAFPIGFVGGGIVLLVLYVARSLSDPWVSIVVNRELPSEYRATALSAIEMIKKFPYIVIAGIAGAMIDGKMLSQICFLITGVIAVILVVHRVFLRRVR